jgi:hypothetical protein
MAFDPQLWNRFEGGGAPVYVRKDRPDWFVPNKAGDRILSMADSSHSLNTNGDLATSRFLDRLPGSQPFEYPGRASLLKTEYFRELWFHITNRCNMKCTSPRGFCGYERKSFRPGWQFTGNEIAVRVWVLEARA